MILISGVIIVETDDRAKALELTRPLVAATLEEPGCRAYGFWEDPDTPGRIRVFEEWESADALKAHFGSVSAPGTAHGSPRPWTQVWLETCTSFID